MTIRQTIQTISRMRIIRPQTGTRNPADGTPDELAARRYAGIDQHQPLP